jgi:hypothetical protein
MAIKGTTQFVQEQIRLRIIDKFTGPEFVEAMKWTIEEVLDAFSYEVNSNLPEVERIIDDN